MYCRLDENHRAFRDARAILPTLCKASQATVILIRNVPVAILTPLHFQDVHNPGPKDRMFAAAKKRFHTALERLRTH